MLSSRDRRHPGGDRVELASGLPGFSIVIDYLTELRPRLPANSGFPGWIDEPVHVRLGADQHAVHSVIPVLGLTLGRTKEIEGKIAMLD